MKINQKGQALVEFILILPVLIFAIFAIVDFGRIIYTKNDLEMKSSDVLTLVEEGKNYNELVEYINDNTTYDVQVSLDYDSENYLTIKLDGIVEIFTPGLNLIIGDPFYTTVKRVTVYEE